MRFHVVSLPHTQTTLEYSSCAFTEKVRKFCVMMKALGHTVFLYAGDQNEAPCDELITCIREDTRQVVVGNNHYTTASFDRSLPHWRHFNHRAARGIRERMEPHDIICVIGGAAHKQVTDAVPELLSVEFGVGYGGVYLPYKVFESYAWMHTVYGSQHPHDPCSVDGNWFDEVIPGYLDPSDFPFRDTKDDYFLYVGRMIDRKGISVADQICKELGKKLVLAGPGVPLAEGENVEYVGVIGPEERGRLMAGAKALIAPTIYIEPFGNVAVEAMTCGTPVISTDWGAFTETVVPGVTGFRCRSFQEFLDAAEAVDTLNPKLIRDFAVANFSLDVVGKMYEHYFKRLLTLHSKGWYERNWNK